MESVHNIFQVLIDIHRNKLIERKTFESCILNLSDLTLFIEQNFTNKNEYVYHTKTLEEDFLFLFDYLHHYSDRFRSKEYLSICNTLQTIYTIIKTIDTTESTE